MTRTPLQRALSPVSDPARLPRQRLPASPRIVLLGHERRSRSVAEAGVPGHADQTTGWDKDQTSVGARSTLLPTLASVESSSAALAAHIHARGCRAVAVRDEPTRRSLSGHETALWELLSGPGLRVARPGQGLSRRTRLGRPVWMMSFELGLFRWPRLQLARLCCEHASVVVVRPPVLQSFYAWRRARWVLSGERSAWMCTAISVRSLSSRTVICARPVGSRRRRRRSSCSRRAWRRRTEWRSR
jgi:hypothetical protein